MCLLEERRAPKKKKIIIIKPQNLLITNFSQSFYSYFLFDRSQMNPPGKSEIHSLKFTLPNSVDIVVYQHNSPPSIAQWKYIGSVKKSKLCFQNDLKVVTSLYWSSARNKALMALSRYYRAVHETFEQNLSNLYELNIALFHCI